MQDTASSESCFDSDSDSADMDDILSLSDGEISALIAELEASIDEERRKEEQLALDAYQQARAQEASAEEDISELFEFQQKLNIRDEQFVLCPLCKRDGLHVRNGVVFCACGMRLDGGTFDSVTIDMVKERLAQVLTKHEQSPCTSTQPKFEQRTMLKYSFLHILCDQCHTDEIVL